MATKNAIDSDKPIEVSIGGTGNSILTDHGVLVGSGASAITVLSVGGTGELFVGTVGSDPAFATSAIGDFTFTSSTANQARVITVVNTDNTAAATSAAQTNITVGGANVADPQIKYTVTGATTFSAGIDNSDSDKFKISANAALETTTVLISTAEGEITMPLQPAFLFYNNADVLNVTGDGTVHTCIYNTSVYDQNGDYDGISTFTAPVSGKYHFCYAVPLDGLDSSMYGLTMLNASNRTISLAENMIGLSRGTIRGSFWGNSFVDMDASDTVTISVIVSGSVKTVDQRGNATAVALSAFFGGRLVC